MKDTSVIDKIILVCVFIVALCAIGAVISIGIKERFFGRLMVYGMSLAFLVAMSTIVFTMNRKG